MSATTIVLEDSTEELVFYPPAQFMAQASAATIRVGTPAVAMPDATTVASVDSVSASTNAAADAGDDTLAFAADPTCTPDRLYLLEHSSFDPLPVLVKATGATVQLSEPLPVDVPSGATLKGIAITHSLSTAQTETSGVCVAQLTGTFGGVGRAWSHRFRIYPRNFEQRLTAVDLLVLAPEMESLRQSTDLTFSEAIAGGYEQLVSDLEAQKYEVHKINTMGKLNLATVGAILWRSHRTNAGPAAEHTIAAKEDYREELRKAIMGSEFWYDRADSGDVALGNTEAIRGVRVRL